MVMVLKEDTIPTASKIASILTNQGPMRVVEVRKTLGLQNPENYDNNVHRALQYALRHNYVQAMYLGTRKDFTYFVPSNPPKNMNEKLTRGPKKVSNGAHHPEVNTPVGAVRILQPELKTPVGAHLVVPQPEFTPVILTQAPTAAVQPPAPVAAPPSVIYTPTPSPVNVALAVSLVTAGSGSMIVAKRDMKTLLDAVLSCNEHFNPQLEALVLDLINRTA